MIMKFLKAIYAPIAILLIPILIGSSVADYLLGVYAHFEHHFLAGLVILVVAALVGSWLPAIHAIDQPGEVQYYIFVLLGIGGPIIPTLIFGFDGLGYYLSASFLVTTLGTLSESLRNRAGRSDEPV